MKNQFTITTCELEDIDYKKDLLVCLVDVNSLKDEQLFCFSQRYLNINEQQIFQQRKKKLAKKEYIASRFLIKSIITKWFGCAFSMLSVHFNQQINYLQVYFKQQALPYNISLSHCRGQVLLVMARDSIHVGIDIEYMDNKRNVKNLAKHFFHQQEQDFVDEKSILGFYKLWTIKEALAKMRGQSLMSIIKDSVLGKLNDAYVYTQYDANFMLTLATSSPLNNVTLYKLQRLPLR